MPSLSPLSHPLAIRPEHVAQCTTTLKVKQQSNTLSSGNFTVSRIDASGRPESEAESTPLFTVTSPFASWTRRRTFLDASGLPLFEIASVRLGGMWTLHLPGSSRKTEQPIATILPKRRSGAGDKFDVHLHLKGDAADAAEEREPVLEVRGQDAFGSVTHVFHRKTAKCVMSVRLEKRGMFAGYVVPFRRPEWEVSVAKGMDVSLASAITVLLAMMLYNNSSTGY
ncbi:hypothetical protein BDW74DRAFT_151542 [Aspergillus multicolor]|uniref:uncharacterized protein n=1 Tax=Aspergillus multicolor TaxID=41759 RepID=UPI003CCDE8E7